MIKIVVQSDIAETIRQSNSQIELVDDKGIRVGFARRAPTEQEVEYAMRCVGKAGPRFTIEELIAKVEAL